MMIDVNEIAQTALENMQANEKYCRLEVSKKVSAVTLAQNISMNALMCNPVIMIGLLGATEEERVYGRQEIVAETLEKVGE